MSIRDVGAGIPGRSSVSMGHHASSHGCYSSFVGKGSKEANIMDKYVYRRVNNNYLRQGRDTADLQTSEGRDPGMIERPSPVWQLDFLAGYQPLSVRPVETACQPIIHKAETRLLDFFLTMGTTSSVR